MLVTSSDPRASWARVLTINANVINLLSSLENLKRHHIEKSTIICNYNLVVTKDRSVKDES